MKKIKAGSTVLLLGLVSLLNDFSSDMIRPILPMFITSLGGAGIAIGLIRGVRKSVSSILKIVSGYYSDKVGKRMPFVIGGYFTSSLFKFLLAFSNMWQQALVFIGLERTGKGLRDAPRDAIISNIVKKKGKAFGVHRALDTVGAILGSITVFILYWYLDLDFVTIIITAGFVGFLALIPLFFVSEPEVETEESTSFQINISKLSTPLKFFMVIAGIYAMANYGYMFFVLETQSSFSGKIAVGAPILLYVLYNIFYAGFAVPFGALSDKIGREKVLMFGYGLFGLVSLGFSLFNSTIAYIFLFSLYGLVYAAVYGNQRAFVSDLSGKEIRGTALGTFQAVISLSALLGGVIAGILWDINPNFTFYYGALFSCLSVILFLSFWWSKRYSL